MPTTLALQILFIVTCLLGFFVMFVWSTYNSFIEKRNEVRTDFADIAVQMKKRAALVDQLVLMVREYAKHEKGTFENVAKARSALDTSSTVKDAAKVDNMFTATLRSLFSVVENYPKLQASTNYLSLRDDLKLIEDAIARYREEYNQTVNEYNTSIQTFPNMIVAGLFHFDDEPLFSL